MRQTYLGYEQQFYIEGTQISGVQSVQGSYSISEKPINILGWGHVNANYYDNNEYIIRNSAKGFILNEDGFEIMLEKSCDETRDNNLPESLAVLNAPLEGDFSIDSILVSEDFMLNYTGDYPFTGSIHHENQYWGFASGYITNHTVSCSIGQLPTTSTKIRVFGDMGGGPSAIQQEEKGVFPITREDGGLIIQQDSENPTIYNAAGDKPFPEIRLTNQESITVEIGGNLPEYPKRIGEEEDSTKDLVMDRVTNFTHNINIPIDPIYVVGNEYAVQVDVVWPMTTQTDFTIEVDKRKYKSMRKYLKSPTLHNLAIRINDCFGVEIQKYLVKKARLINESMSSSTDGRVTVNLSYLAYYNKR